MKSSILYSSLAITLLTTACSKKEAEPVVAPTQTSAKVQPEVPPSKPSPEPTQKPELKTTKSALVAETETITADVQKKVSAATSSVTSALAVQPDAVLADLDLSMDEVKKQVAGFDLEKTTAYATQYKDLILSYKDKIGGLSESVKNLSMSDMLGGKATELKNQVSEYTETLTSLKDRYGVYVSKLKDYGVDLSAYGL